MTPVPRQEPPPERADAARSGGQSSAAPSARQVFLVTFGIALLLTAKESLDARWIRQESAWPWTRPAAYLAAWLPWCVAAASLWRFLMQPRRSWKGRWARLQVPLGVALHAAAALLAALPAQRWVLLLHREHRRPLSAPLGHLQLYTALDQGIWLFSCLLAFAWMLRYQLRWQAAEAAWARSSLDRSRMALEAATFQTDLPFLRDILARIQSQLADQRDKALASLRNLCAHLRTLLEPRPAEASPVVAELSALHRHLELWNDAGPSALRSRIAVEGDWDGWRLPTHLLSACLERALRLIQKPGVLVVTARPKEDRLALTIDAAPAAEGLEGDSAAELALLRTFVRDTCGPRAELSHHAMPGHGFRLTLLLPNVPDTSDPATAATAPGPARPAAGFRKSGYLKAVAGVALFLATYGSLEVWMVDPRGLHLNVLLAQPIPWLTWGLLVPLLYATFRKLAAGRARPVQVAQLGFLSLFAAATHAAWMFPLYAHLIRSNTPQGQAGPSLQLLKSFYLGWGETTFFMGLVAWSVIWGLHAQREGHRAFLQWADEQRRAALDRLTMLRRRIDPHFLVNALACAQGYVTTDPGLASRMLDRVGRFLGQALDPQERPVWSLREELDTVENYLEIHRLRFGDRLQVCLQVSPDLDPRQVLVPSMLVQPLVENAIHHGLRGRSGPCRLAVEAALEGERLRLSVSDDGPGWPEDTPDRLRVGLGTTRERLRATFGPGTDLRLETSRWGGARVVALLPLQTHWTLSSSVPILA